jgi:heptosyltransferase-2
VKALIIKLNATGDVVRTTPLLRRLTGQISWVTARGNLELLQGLSTRLRCFPWENRAQALEWEYDLVLNLEDDVESAAFATSARCAKLFGAYLGAGGDVCYTDDARGWFDMSLISVHGRKQADALKYLNRYSYQDLIFKGLGMTFEGEGYVLPEPARTDLSGDVAIAPNAGRVWPMKNWAYYDRLQCELESVGLRVNVLPHRRSLLEHLGDIRNHRCLVSGDSLPMHLALGMRIPCVTLFNCTSPWEIYGYNVQTQVVSPLLQHFFYRRGVDSRATTAIQLEDVFDAVLHALRLAWGSHVARASGIGRCLS